MPTGVSPDPQAMKAAVVLFTMLAVGACAGVEESLYLSPPPPPGTSCYPQPAPPLPAEIVEEPTLRTSLRPSTGERWSAVLVLDPDTAGGWGDPELRGTTGPVPPDLIGRVAAGLRTPSPDTARFLLRIDAAEEVTLRTGPRELCPPVLLDRQRVLREFSEAFERRVPLESERVVLHLRVDTLGSVSEVRVQEEAIDRPTQALIVAFARERLRFRPGTADRVPLGLWVQIPFSVEIRQRERDPCPGVLRDAPDRPAGMPRC